MANRFFPIVATLLLGVLVSSTAMAEVTIGDAAPDFTASDAITGKPITLSSFKDKLVVLEWNNPQCPFVHKFYSVGAMQQLQDNAIQKGVVWITIDSSAQGHEGYLANDAAARDFLSDHNAHPSHYIRDVDGHIGHLYGAKSTPHMFVIDTDGKIAYMGAMDDMPTADPADIATAKNYVARALRALTEGKEVAVKSTQPYGCFIKY